MATETQMLLWDSTPSLLDRLEGRCRALRVPGLRLWVLALREAWARQAAARAEAGRQLALIEAEAPEQTERCARVRALIGVAAMGALWLGALAAGTAGLAEGGPDLRRGPAMVRVVRPAGRGVKGGGV